MPVKISKYTNQMINCTFQIKSLVKPELYEQQVNRTYQFRPWQLPLMPAEAFADIA